MSSLVIHCPYIITGKEFKEKHILEQDKLFTAVISSGLKEKNKLSFSLLRTPDSNLLSRARDPFLLLRDPGLLSNLSRN